MTTQPTSTEAPWEPPPDDKRRRPTVWIDQIDQDLGDAEANANDAEDAANKASSETDKAEAEADAAKADAEKAGACLRGSVEAFGAAFSSGGLEAAVAELQKLAGRCAPG
jgi:F0F1-type ATP synthase membrane subunit b/b'